MTDSIKIVKASGLIENYDENKLSFSLHQARVPIALVNQTMAFVRSKLRNNVTTQDLHELVKDYLTQNGLPAEAINYDLKRAVMRLGPTGFPFEKYLARILETQGFKTEVGLVIAGRCVSHEIDIDAQKEDQHYLIECKFHNAPGNKTDVQVALYTYARFLDIRAALTEQTHHAQYHQAWLVTNTKVTKDAVDYASCLNMRLISWTYPHHDNLREMIIKSGLYPITSLDLSLGQQQTLIQRNIVACIDLKDAFAENRVSDTISNDQKQKLLQKISSICK